MIERILIATDGSDGTRAAEEYALELAELADAEVHVLNVVETSASYILTVDLSGKEMEQAEQYGKDAVADVVDRAEARAIQAQGVVKRGKIAPEIVEYAGENDIDQLVIGRAGHGAVGQYLGSTAEKLVYISDVPVTVVRGD